LAQSAQAPSAARSPWPRLKKYFGADKLVAAGTAGTAPRWFFLASPAIRRPHSLQQLSQVFHGLRSFATLNVSAQMAFAVLGSGTRPWPSFAIIHSLMSAGSAMWGQTLAWIGLRGRAFDRRRSPDCCVPLCGDVNSRPGADVDMSPSLHCQAPIISSEAAADRGPVLVTSSTACPRRTMQPFLEAMTFLKQERHRDGAFNWACIRMRRRLRRLRWKPSRSSSWLEHLRQHERVTQADRQHQERIIGLLAPGTTPAVTT